MTQRPSAFPTRGDWSGRLNSIAGGGHQCRRRTLQAQTMSCSEIADDTTIHTSNTDPNVVHDTLQNSIYELIKWTEQNHMSLHPGKTKWMLVTTRQKRQNLTDTLPAIRMHNHVVEETNSHKVLGIIIDNNLSWSLHIAYLCKVVSSKVFQLSKIKHFLNFQARKLFFSRPHSGML